jgi:ankyrin repeat protein
LTKKTVRLALENLPKGLNATYDGAFSRLEISQHDDAIRALTWVALSQVPLTVMELAAAVSINLRKSTIMSSDASNQVADQDNSESLFNPDDTIQDPIQVLYLLPGLYNIQNKQSTETGEVISSPADNLSQVIVPTHFTLFEYLTSEEIKKSKSSMFALNRTTANIQIAEACLQYHKYLSEKNSKMSVVELRAEYPLWEYAALYGLRHADNGYVNRKAWPTSLQQLIRSVLLDGGQPFTNLKLWSGHPSQRANDLPIQYAVERKLMDIVPFLLDEKLADINVKPKFGDSPVILAVKNMDMDMLCLLLDNYGADPNVKAETGEPALLCAISNRDTNIIKMLLEKGADIDATDKTGHTALFQAVIDNEDELVQLLLKYNPNLNAKNDKGETPLHLAVKALNPIFVRLLLKNGADINVKTNLEETALHFAAKIPSLPMLELLLDHHADVNAINAAGETAIYLVARNLRNYGDNREDFR